MQMEREREAVVAYGRKMLSSSLTTGTGGNISVIDRGQQLIAISPSGMDYETIRPEDVVVVSTEGRTVEGDRKPSTEIRLHLAHYRLRAEINAVIHAHPPFATTVACLGWEIPPIHYLVSFSGRKVPIARYATYGTEELARLTAEAIGPHNAVLMSNHGILTVGQDLASAFATAEIIELMARVFLQAKAVGEPQCLSDTQMDALTAARRASALKMSFGTA
jgi:L-fuculose-phosphate aldolase